MPFPYYPIPREQLFGGCQNQTFPDERRIECHIDFVLWQKPPESFVLYLRSNIADAIEFLTPFLLEEREGDKMIARDDGDDKIRDRREAGHIVDKASEVCDHL